MEARLQAGKDRRQPDRQLVRSPPEMKPSAEPRQYNSVDPGRASQLEEIYARADRDDDGRLTRAELILRLRKDEELRELLNLPAYVGDGERDMFESVFQGMDVDDDRCVTVEEFVRYLSQAAAVGVPQPQAQAQAPAQAHSQYDGKHKISPPQLGLHGDLSDR